MNSFHLDWRFFLVFEIYFGHSDVFLQFGWREITGINIQIIFLSFFVGQDYHNSVIQHLEGTCGWDWQTGEKSQVELKLFQAKPSSAKKNERQHKWKDLCVHKFMYT